MRRSRARASPRAPRRTAAGRRRAPCRSRPATVPTSASTTLVGSGGNEVVGDRRPHHPRPGHDVPSASHASRRARSSVSRSRSGGRTSARSSTPFHPTIRFSAACPGERLDVRAELGELRRALLARVADDGGDLGRERGGERGDRADGARLATPVDQRLRADEDVEAVEHVPLERVHGVSETFIPTTFSASSRRRASGAGSNAYPAVWRTRRRRTAAGRRPPRRRAGACAARSGSSLKYGGPITATASAPVSAACAAKRDRVRRHLRAAVRGDEHPARDRLDPELEASAALLGRSRTASPFVPRRGHPVQPGAREVGVRQEGRLVERRPPRASGVEAAAIAPRRRAISGARGPRARARPSRRMRRSRVSGRFTSSTHCTYSRWWLYESRAKAS